MKRMSRLSDSKVAARLKKIKKVDMRQIVRRDDDTVAYYCEETDEIILFIDVATDDCLIHFKNWGKAVEPEIKTFLWKYLVRTDLHEWCHWGGIEDSKKCEYVALWLTFESEGVARMVSNLLYPSEKRSPKIGVIEIEED